jgi:sulfite oxidase
MHRVLACRWLAAGGAAIASTMSIPVYAKEKKKISMAELKAHDNSKTGVWVSYKNKVYDVTGFIDQHPGGKERIMMAAGGAIDPYWNLYQQHLTPEVRAILEEQTVVGELEVDESCEISLEDPFRNDPERHPALIVQKDKPFNAEPPLALLRDHWVTPETLHYKRNHMPVPPNRESFTFQGDTIVISDLSKSFQETTLTVTLQCGGNRRKEMDAVEPTQGLKWGPGVISTSQWTGIKLSDFLQAHGIDKTSGKHLCFSGSDQPYDASLSIEHALDPNKEVLLAYKMNGKDIPADHGRPLRLIVPGVIGARNVKWVDKVYISDEPAKSTWQRGPAYRKYSPKIKNVKETVKEPDAAAIYDMPVQSVICVIDSEQDEVRGLAWSGGGRRITKVEVSLDKGETWQSATLEQGSNQPSGRAWAWTFWSFDADEMMDNCTEVWSRATDEKGNAQPLDIRCIWNFRGILNNSVHRKVVR